MWQNSSVQTNAKWWFLLLWLAYEVKIQLSITQTLAHLEESKTHCFLLSVRILPENNESRVSTFRYCTKPLLSLTAVNKAISVLGLMNLYICFSSVAPFCGYPNLRIGDILTKWKFLSKLGGPFRFTEKSKIYVRLDTSQTKHYMKICRLSRPKPL